MNYEWFYAGNMLHLIPDDVYNGRTLCNSQINGRSSDSMNDRVGVSPTCTKCLKLRSSVKK